MFYVTANNMRPSKKGNNSISCSDAKQRNEDKKRKKRRKINKIDFKAPVWVLLFFCYFLPHLSLLTSARQKLGAHPYRKCCFLGTTDPFVFMMNVIYFYFLKSFKNSSIDKSESRRSFLRRPLPNIL